jgi:hypothetical protein
MPEGSDDHAGASRRSFDRVEDVVLPNAVRPQTSKLAAQFLADVLGIGCQECERLVHGPLDGRGELCQILLGSSRKEELRQGRARASPREVCSAGPP